MAYYKHLLYNEAYYVLCGRIMSLIIRNWHIMRRIIRILYDAYYATHNVQGAIMKVILNTRG